MDAFTVKSRQGCYKQRTSGLRVLFSLMLVAVLLNTQIIDAAAPPHEDNGWFVNMGRFAASAHGTFSCQQCHGDMKKDQTVHPEADTSALLKKNANRDYNYKRCGSCHKPTYEQYLLGAHARKLDKERTVADAQYDKLSEAEKAPTCGTCHSAHYAKAHLSRVEIGRNMVSVCGACHPAQTATYLDNYHGKAAVNLGDKNAAFCTDCHGAHHCQSLKDKKTALMACRRCHPDAKEGFTQVVIHPTTVDLPESDPQKKAHVALIRVLTILMTILVILVIGFFYGHSFMWILRELHEKLRKHQ